MNKLQDKAAELIALGESYGLKPEITTQTEFRVWLTFTPNISTAICYTDNNKVSVMSWERMGRRTEKIAQKHLGEYLNFASEQNKKRAAK